MTQFASAVRGRALLEEALVPSPEGKRPCLHPLGECRPGPKAAGAGQENGKSRRAPRKERRFNGSPSEKEIETLH